MSKNSSQQRLECFKDWLHSLESKRKRNQKVNKQKVEKLIKYHPSLEYDGE
jgi:hypothetical protein